MAALEIGQVIKGRYRVEAYLGGGGMADVYKVFDTQRRAYLAMKVLKQDLAEDREFLRRFTGEARRLAKLQHPNIVRYYGLEQDGRTAFMLLDFIDGITLKTAIFDENAPMMAEKIALIMQDICSALNYAHESGYVHCDVKPANIMINRDGNVFLTDFGIAREVDATTSTMVGFGAPAYMAPEQVQGKDPSPRTDIYSLGVTLYEMLTDGRRPFTGNLAKTTGTASQRVRWEQIKMQAPSPRIYNEAISVGMEAVVMKCLEKEPRKRYRGTMTLLAGFKKALPPLREAEMKDRKCLRSFKMRKEGGGGHPNGAGGLAKLAASIPIPFIQKNPTLLPVLAGAVVVGIVLISLLSKPSEKDGSEEIAVVLETSEEGKSQQMIPEPQAEAPEQAQSEPVEEIVEEPVMADVPQACNQDGDVWTDPTDMAPLVCVEEGDFVMGSKDSILWQMPTKQNEIYFGDIYLDAFWIDQTEVSIGQFKQFVDETGYITEAEKEHFGHTMNVSEGKWPINPRADWLHPHGTSSEEADDRPVAQVSWNDAMAYCEWAGRTLPTEAQWEKAARGTYGFHFPFEDDDDYVFCLNANFSENSLGAKGSKECNDGYKFAAPVTEDYYCISYLGSCDSVLNNPYNVYNMLGNVSEWVLDDFSGKWYNSLPTTTNPVNITGGELKSIRGGNWGAFPEKCRPTNRNSDAASSAWDTVGFRCVYNP